MAQNRLITDLVELIQPGNDDLLVIVDNTTDPTLSTTKKITYANLIEDLQDMVDLLIQEGNGIIASYSDAGNTITLSVSGDTTIQKSIYSSGGTSIGTRQQLNFIPGAGVTLTGADNPGNNRVDLTVNTTTVATGVTLSGTGSPVSPLESITTLGNGTKQLNFRGVKAGSGKLSVNTGDGGNSIVIDVVPSGIDINTLSVGSPLAIALGGTNATTASNARANLGAAQLGVNDDITSIVGLTTPLSIAQGGTNGGTVQLGLRNLEGIRTVANVGTAGQSLVVNASTLVSNSYRAELKGVRAGSSKITVTTVGNDISVDANAILILNSATEDINLNNNKITSVAAPTASTDAANKGYVDAVAQGLVVKEAVIVATTTSQAGTYAASGLTFTYTATGTPSIDSVPITATGTRVLFKNQTTGSQNGIYALTTSGETGVSAVFTRADDYNSSLEASAGSFAFVLSGATNSSKQFVQTTVAPTLDTDPLVFTVLNDLTIANGSVTNAKLADMPASRIKGAVTSGAPQDLTADQVITVVNSATSQIDSARINLTPITGDIVINASGVSSIGSGVIVNAEISPTAEIAVSKLADGTARQLLQTSADGNEVEWASDIVVPGTLGVTGSATFSGSTIFASGVVVSGSASFSGTTTAPTLASGNASSNVATTQFVANALAGVAGGAVASADRLTTPRAIALSGDVVGSVNFDGSSGVTIATTIQGNSVALGTDTTGNYIGTATTSGNGISGSATGEGSALVVSSNATNNNSPSTIVFRDSFGNFNAGTIGASLSGNATTANTLTTPRTITLSGDVGGSVSFDGGSNVTISTTVQANSVTLGTDTTGSYVAQGATAGNGLSGSVNSENGTFTVTSNATQANTANTIVYRDANRNFNAGTIFAEGIGVSGAAAFSGTTTAPTLAAGNSSSNVATTQFVANAISGVTAGAVTSADKLTTPRAITLGGGVTGTVNFDGSSNVTITATVATNANLTGDITSTGNSTSIASNVIVDADINASAAIAGTKISPNFGSQTIVTTGTIELGNASDTTLSRSAAGVLAVEGVVVPTVSSTNTLTNKTLTDPAIVGTIIEDVFTIADGAAFEVDPSNGSIQLITLGASRTPKATNFIAGESITLMVNDGTAYTLTWTDATWGGSGVIWVGGTAPTLATSGYTVLQFWKVSTQVYGALVGAVA